MKKILTLKISQNSGANDNPNYMYYSPVSTMTGFVISNTLGNVDNAYYYNPYGELQFGTVGSSFGYEGQYIGDQNQYSTTSNPLYSGLVYMKNRYYDPATGVFVSQDPLINQTNQAYVYSNDNPVGNWDPSGDNTEGYCVSVNIGIAVADIAGSICLVKTDSGNSVGVTGTVASGVGISELKIANAWKMIRMISKPQLSDMLEASIDATWQTSNAGSLSELTGGFNYAGGNIGAGLGGGYERFWGCGGISGNDVSIGLGVGVEVSTGYSYTGLLETFRPGSSAARVASDEINGFNVINPADWLSNVASWIF